MSDQPGGTPQEIQVSLPPEMFGGVWANFATVTHSEHEFTIDFIRVDPLQSKGMVTARVNVSPLFITQLQEALKSNWDQYAKKAMPREVQDGSEA
jgi:hypothetical protein